MNQYTHITHMHRRLQVRLNISPQKLLYYYEGEVSTVVATTTDGRVIRFPANILRSIVQTNGVQGLFELVYDENHKFISISRVSS